MSRHNYPCDYCDGEGYGEVQTDVDDWRKVRCDYCGGTRLGGRPAGDRDTSAPTFDGLIGLSKLRRLYAREHSRYVHLIATRDRQDACLLRFAEMDHTRIESLYLRARRRVMMPVSSLARCDMLARSEIMARQMESLLKTARGEA